MSIVLVVFVLRFIGKLRFPQNESITAESLLDFCKSEIIGFNLGCLRKRMTSISCFVFFGG